MSKQLKFIDLFAGIGGTRIAFEENGCVCIMTSEIDASAIKIYNKNFNNTDEHFMAGDITKIDINLIPDHDLLIAGFPCQPFSIAGLRRGLKDERGKVFLKIIKILQKKKPKAFLLENVKGLMSHEKGETLKYMIKLLEDQGYFVKYKVLNTSKITKIPQNRERIFLVGFKTLDNFNKFEFPKELSKTEGIRKYLSRGEVDDKYFYTKKSKIYFELKKQVTDNNSVYQWRRHYVRKNKSNVCPTLTANMGRGGHNVPIVTTKKGIRKLTPRECANLQGFPKKYKLEGIVSDNELYHKIGNSVTIPVISEIAKKMIESLR